MRLREIRVGKGLTQTRLAELSGVSQTYISELELGRFQPTIKILRKLAKALDISITELIDDIEAQVG